MKVLRLIGVIIAVLFLLYISLAMLLLYLLPYVANNLTYDIINDNWGYPIGTLLGVVTWGYLIYLGFKYTLKNVKIT